MTPRSRHISRRQILAGIGTVGLVTAGAGLGRGLREDPQYTHYTYAQEQESGPDLLVAWYETYNGEPTDDRSSGTIQPNNASFESAAASDEFAREMDLVLDTRGPVVDVPGVVPGDRGTLIVGLTTDVEAAALWFRPYAPEQFPDGTPNFRENDRTEPEITAGDDSPDRGELQDVLRVSVWYDTGALNSGLGGCNGQRDVGETVIASGTLREVAAELADGVRLQTELFGNCLAPGETRCVGVSWEVPEDAGNRIQTDSVRFDLQFAATACGESPVNPFGGA